MEKFFSTFHGADLDRFTECIAAIRKNGASYKMRSNHENWQHHCV